jgi:drug/metabolite transporter (DMT)-like permease
MFQTLIFLHSVIRWFVLGSLVFALYEAYRGYWIKRIYTKGHNSLRHWTATIAHIQLVIGIILYSKSVTVKSLFNGMHTGNHITEPVFFGIIHIALMLLAIIFITIGSAMAKRKTKDEDKFKTMLVWFGAALLIILIAIPWPFSPLAQRPYLRPF